MSLVPFQKNKKRKQAMIVFSISLVLLVAGIILYRTFALFEETDEYDVIKGSVPNYLENYDIKINFKVDGVSVNQAPNRNDKKGVENITCDKGATTKEEAQKNENNPDKIQIKPNVYSWRGINVSNAHLSSYNYKRNLDSHMMKNTEWGAIAYLQHSDYGSHESVRINNNEAYITGYAAVREPTCGYTGTNEECNKYGKTDDITKQWNNNIGYLASTTGNISGIYDMNGGAHEYVMGVMLDSTNTTPCSGYDATYNSGFDGPYCGEGQGDFKIDGLDFPSDTRYYDIYSYATDNEHYNRRIIGGATGEMGPFASIKYVSKNRKLTSWYNDEAFFMNFASPWFYRGGDRNTGSDSGLFGFSSSPGFNEYPTFRVVLIC